MDGAAPTPAPALAMLSGERGRIAEAALGVLLHKASRKWCKDVPMVAHLHAASSATGGVPLEHDDGRQCDQGALGADGFPHHRDRGALPAEGWEEEDRAGDGYSTHNCVPAPGPGARGMVGLAGGDGEDAHRSDVDGDGEPREEEEGDGAGMQAFWRHVQGHGPRSDTWGQRGAGVAAPAGEDVNEGTGWGAAQQYYASGDEGSAWGASGGQPACYAAELTWEHGEREGGHGSDGDWATHGSQRYCRGDAEPPKEDGYGTEGDGDSGLGDPPATTGTSSRGSQASPTPTMEAQAAQASQVCAGHGVTDVQSDASTDCEDNGATGRGVALLGPTLLAGSQAAAGWSFGSSRLAAGPSISSFACKIYTQFMPSQ